MWENMYTTKRIISPNGKERIIVILCNVQYKDGCQPKEKIINIEKKEEEYVYCEWEISAWHVTFIIEHKISNQPY